MSSFNPSMEDLPVHVMLDILSRLPVKTIIHCRCVCNKWRNLVSDPYFANLHFSKSPEALLIHHNSAKLRPGRYHQPGILKLVDIKDEHDDYQLQPDPVMTLDLSLGPRFKKSQILPVGSVNGFICLWQFGPKHDNTYICNPITREYMVLPRQKYYREGYARIVYGFGFGLLTNDYKVVRTFQGNIPPDPTSGSRPSLLATEVYTLGSAQWRSLGQCPYWRSGHEGPFLNGFVHWTVIDRDSPEKLCAFDFENESFMLFPSPPIEGSPICYQTLGVLKGCLCQSDTYDTQFMIWVMKEYGIKSSWCKEVVIKESISPDLDWVMWQPMNVIKGLKDGTVLMVYWEDELVVYCPQSKTIEDTKIFDRYLSGMAYRPSFVRLKNFELERVHLF